MKKGADMLKVIRKYNLPEEFPEKPFAMPRPWPKLKKKITRDVGFVDLPIVTMDGADAKDLMMLSLWNVPKRGTFAWESISPTWDIM